MTNQNYLTRLQQRELEKEIKDCASFGIFACGTIFIISGWSYFFTAFGHYTILRTLLALSGMMFIIGVIIPQALILPQKIFASVGNSIFLTIFKILLAIIYVFIIIPIGIFYKPKNFIQWEDSNKISDLDWEDKCFDYESINGKNSHKNCLFWNLNLIRFFIKRRQLILIPAIIAIIIIGIIFSFIQCAMVTPFIYTLL